MLQSSSIYRLLALLLLTMQVALAQHPASRVQRHRAVVAARPAPAAAGELAYYCASGNTVKYHSSASCQGLTRCSTAVKPLALAEAQGRMEPCRICH